MQRRGLARRLDHGNIVGVFARAGAVQPPKRQSDRRVAAGLVAHDSNPRRVLEKCGFRAIATDRGFAGARSAEIEELVLRLDEPI